MADPQAATLTQLRNIQGKTGKTIAELHAAVAAAGLDKHAEKRSWLMTQFQLGYGDANALLTVQGQSYATVLANLDVALPAPAGDSDALASIYTGAKAPLRALHDAVIGLVDTFGHYEQAPKKTYVSLRRKKQFAMVGPATKDLIEIGLNVRDLPPHQRLKAVPPGGMCQYTLRLGSDDEIDADLRRWLKAAYDAAG